MGCGASVFEANFRDIAEGQLERFTDVLEIKSKDLKAVYKLFCKIDEDGSGHVGVEEFFDHFNLEYGAFAERAFSVMDVDRSGNSHLKLDFSEFFVGLYNYCTQSHETLVKFAFDLFDIDGGGHISLIEMEELVKMVYGKKTSEGQLKKLMKNMDRDGSGEITLNEFRALEKKNRSLLHPAFQLQQSLAKGIMGASFWNKQTKKRMRIKPGEDLIEWFYAETKGEKLDRQKINENANELQEGEISNEVGAPSRDLASVMGTILRKLEYHEKITIYEERNVTEKVMNEAEGKVEDVTKTWLLINESRSVWVLASDCHLFANKSGIEKRVAKKQGGKEEVEDDVRKKRAEQQGALDNKNWIETTDPKTGRDYWYDTLTLETTWIKPPGASKV
jgi:Ca2+-binding EF-hand superfamily protein